MRDPLITQLSVSALFKRLPEDEKLYAHHLSR